MCNTTVGSDEYKRLFSWIPACTINRKVSSTAMMTSDFDDTIFLVVCENLLYKLITAFDTDCVQDGRGRRISHRLITAKWNTSRWK